MTAIELVTEYLAKGMCPADAGIETEHSLQCRDDIRTNEEIYRCGECEKCWNSEVVRGKVEI